MMNYFVSQFSFEYSPTGSNELDFKYFLLYIQL